MFPARLRNLYLYTVLASVKGIKGGGAICKLYATSVGELLEAASAFRAHGVVLRKALNGRHLRCLLSGKASQIRRRLLRRELRCEVRRYFLLRDDGREVWKARLWLPSVDGCPIYISETWVVLHFYCAVTAKTLLRLWYQQAMYEVLDVLVGHPSRKRTSLALDPSLQHGLVVTVVVR